MPVRYSNLEHAVQNIVESAPVLDMHTHLYPPAFKSLLLWGIDELLTYHYLIAEVLRVTPIPPDEFFRIPKDQQADIIWDELFIKRSPISEACRGVVTCMEAVGLDSSDRDLAGAREWYANQTVEEYMEFVFAKANVSAAVMTNDPFDPIERRYWEEIGSDNPRLLAALRIDQLLLGWDQASNQLREWGYDVTSNLNDSTFSEVRRFLEDWAKKLQPRYMAVSLSPDFKFPDESPASKLIDSCVLPVARELNIPFALMIGVRRQINPALKLAGDGVGIADLSSVEALCVRYPANRFLVTVLSRENQHELCVIARKFSNLMPFGCWWFLNNPSIIKEITRERLELLGWSMIPQHSDARILDQLLYKWPHSRRIISRVLCEKYQDLVDAGWKVTRAEITRDVNRLFTLNFTEFAPDYND